MLSLDFRYVTIILPSIAACALLLFTTRIFTNSNSGKHTGLLIIHCQPPLVIVPTKVADIAVYPSFIGASIVSQVPGETLPLSISNSSNWYIECSRLINGINHSQINLNGLSLRCNKLQVVVSVIGIP